MADKTEALAVMMRKLGRMTTLDAADREAIAALPFTIVAAASGQHLVREGDSVTNCCVLIAGYACRHKLAVSGQRQIVSFHLAGDVLDLQHLLLPQADHNVQTITRSTIGWIPCEALREVAQRRPAIGDALWRDTLIDASIFREWVLNVGRRDAKARVAHMLCEFAVRRQAAGLGDPERFDLPMSQEQIADATGLTAVHVNRMLRLLGEEGVIDRERRQIAITDWKLLRQVADFDPVYLHAA